MREIRPYGSEGGGIEGNRSSLPLSKRVRTIARFRWRTQAVGGSRWGLRRLRPTPCVRPWRGLVYYDRLRLGVA
jgi:hypothetical protein